MTNAPTIAAAIAAAKSHLLAMGLALCRDGLNTELRLGKRAIRDWLNGSRELPKKAHAPVIEWAVKHGMKIN